MGRCRAQKSSETASLVKEELVIIFAVCIRYTCHDLESMVTKNMQHLLLGPDLPKHNVPLKFNWLRIQVGAEVSAPALDHWLFQGFEGGPQSNIYKCKEEVQTCRAFWRSSSSSSCSETGKPSSLMSTLAAHDMAPASCHLESDHIEH